MPAFSDAEIESINGFIEKLGSADKSVGAVALAGFELVKNLTTGPIAPTAPQNVFTGIPDADKALAEAAQVAEIAGRNGVEIEDVIEFAGLLLSLGMTFI